ncbi:hypothetical protein DFR67_11640 [Williamsia limnetica]|uniref:Uncharacterized protein n=1 Tax=Williamsia limnetica TaxID=882452 RepID=A0A318RG37_WILLI|nr:hypothetical protein [Williamsia limnetica]PYE13486.1 hypothetical protein DFR67_11640 [Williamsia limnetica]
MNAGVACSQHPQTRRRRWTRCEAIVDAVAAAPGRVDERGIYRAMTAAIACLGPSARLHLDFLPAGAGSSVFVVADLTTDAGAHAGRTALARACAQIIADPTGYGLSAATAAAALNEREDFV